MAGLVTYTTWARLEPRLSDPSLAPGIQAAVEDPLWLLGRQWQLGELTGEDTGSPIAIEVFGSRAPVQRLLPGPAGGKPIDYDGSASPLDPLVAPEPAPDPATLLAFRLDVAARVAQELGARQVPASVLATLRARYPVDEKQLVSALDGCGPAERARLDLLASRLFDGCALLIAARAGLAAATAQLPQAAVDAVSMVLAAVSAEADLDLVSKAAAPAAPAAWRSESLEYSFALGASAPAGEVVLRAADWDGEELDWWSFDTSTEARLGAGAKPTPLTGVSGKPLTVLPARLGFRGAPAVRYWEFENADVNFGASAAAPHETGLMVVLQFAFVYGGDWSSVPIEVPVGSLVTVASVAVRDTFGVRVLVNPAGIDPAKPATDQTRLWFASGDKTAALFVPPRLLAAIEGDAIEETMLLRDEQANLGWAIELVAPDAAGHAVPWSSLAPPPPLPPASSAALPPDRPALHYRLSSDVPAHWFPLVPEAAGNRLSRYRVGVLPSGSAAPPQFPRSLMLRELAGSGLNEQELPREGRRLCRRAVYARWSDGGTHVWIARRVGAGRGEGSSGLVYDTLEHDTKA